MAGYLEFRVYIGPHYSHYDWSTLSLGQTTSPGSDTTTTSTLNSGGTSVSVAQPTFFPSAGGVFIGPNGTGQAWEYCQFTGKSGSSLTGLVREQIIGTEHNGTHTSGATIRWWWPLTVNDGTLHISESLDESLGVTTWIASLKGALFPTAALRNGHIALVQTRSTTSGSWATALVGFLDTPSVEDEASREARWNVNIVSIASILEKTRVDGVRVGELNVSPLGSASASSTLAIVFDERHNGEYTAALPDLSAQAAIDNTLNTLWIGEMFHTENDDLPTTNSDAENVGELKFSQIYVNPPTGTNVPRWFEMTMVTGTSLENNALYTAIGGGFSTEWLWGGPGTVAPGDRFIFTENIDLFQQYNPIADYAAIYENSAFFSQMLASGGEMWNRYGILNDWRSRVRWGTGNGYINHEDMPDREWDGPTVTAPSEGQTMRYIYTPSAPVDPADYWTTDLVHYAGYQLDEDNESWFMASLPGMGLLLETDITSTVPGTGELLRIVDASGNPNTGGLDDSGVLQIGSEQISYSAKTENGVTVSARGYNSTTAAIHNKDDAVYIVADGLATDAPALTRIELAWNGSIIGKHYGIYVSSLLDTPRTPDTANWGDDWENFNGLVANTDNPQLNYAIAVSRIKHILIIFQYMSASPARARLAELRAILDETKYGADAALPADTVAGDLLEQVLLNAGIPLGAISHSGTPALDQIQTAADNAWLVLSDYADFAGLKVTVARDSKISIAPSTLWSSSQTSTFTWDRSSARKIKKTWNNGEGVSQVVLPWRAPSGEVNGTARYPVEQTAIGSPYEFEETLYNSTAAADIAAQRRYYTMRYPATVLIDATAQQWAKRPGEIHTVNWQTTFDQSTLNRKYIVTKTDHHVEKRMATSAVELQQIEHEENT